MKKITVAVTLAQHKKITAKAKKAKTSVAALVRGLAK